MTHHIDGNNISVSSLFQHVVSEIGCWLLLLQRKLRAFAQLICPPGLWRYLLPLLQCISICLAHLLHAAMQLQCWLAMLSGQKWGSMQYVAACRWLSKISRDAPVHCGCLPIFAV